MSDLRRTEQEMFWFPVVLSALALRNGQRLEWEAIAARVGCSPSALRLWKGRYLAAWEAAHAPGGELWRFLALCGAGTPLPEETAPDNEARR